MIKKYQIGKIYTHRLQEEINLMIIEKLDCDWYLCRYVNALGDLVTDKFHKVELACNRCEECK